MSKRYVLGERLTAREALVAAARKAVRRNSEPPSEIWSLRDVSFSVADGEALGIVGRNGAGKSTVLKILAGITSPTTGLARTRGRVAALLEVGTGFHPELTGRENVFLNGAILGMSRRDLVRRFDQIVEFSGTERFLDTPIKRYSSGMQLRLAFAVAAHLEPDILVVDEVLAVGDAEFQRKCVGRMAEAEQEGRTVVFVSHDLETLMRLCRRGVWLDAGRIRESGQSETVVRRYLASGLAASASGDTVMHAGPVTVTGVRVLAGDGRRDSALLRDESLILRVEFEVAEEVPGLDLALYVTTRGGTRVFDESLSDHGSQRFPPGAYCAELSVPPVLNFGEFTVGVWFGTAQEDILDEPAVSTFTLVGAEHDRPERILVMKSPFSVRPATPTSQ